MTQRLAPAALGLVCVLAVLFLVAFRSKGDLDTPKDESKPELVQLYMVFPCDALVDSATFIYNELKQHTERLVKCHEHFDNSDYKYKKLVCLYIQMDWQNMYDHLMSIKKAHDLMCEDDGTRKNPQYEIYF